MKLTDLLFTLERIETRERNVITESRTVKFAANVNAEALKKAREIIDYSATAELMEPPTVSFRADEVASTPTPPEDKWYPKPGCKCFRCETYFSNGLSDHTLAPAPDPDIQRDLAYRTRPEAGIVLGPQPTKSRDHYIFRYEGLTPVCACGLEWCRFAS